MSLLQYAKDELDHIGMTADGNAFFYGMTSKDEERIKQIAKTL